VARCKTWLERDFFSSFCLAKVQTVAIYGSEELVNISHKVDATFKNPPFDFCNRTIRNTKVQFILSRALQITL
jgi:hypothetical protein